MERYLDGADSEAKACVDTARRIESQDVEVQDGMAQPRRGVAKDRRISVEDAQMRHDRKSRSTLIDGYKRHVLRDLDTELVPAAGVTPTNVPEAAVTDAIASDLERQNLELGELHIDRGYLSSKLVRERPGELEVYCKAWAVRNGEHFPKTQFDLDWERRQIRCPAGVETGFEAAGVVHFPAGTCQACPLRERCTSSKRGRSVSIHPDEKLLKELRRRQLTPSGRQKLRERVGVEHSLAHIGQWQGDRAR